MSEITNGDYGANPCELYGTYTWKILKFPEISHPEIRSNVFEVGGHQWFILVYPEGCTVRNHLSLFLCVAKPDELLPGWSNFAQFTMSVMNKNPKKSKHSETLHEFWKKEHDWGWKKFMELPKLLMDGFIDDYGSLIIKVQVQVIRKCVDRPFPCLDDQYRRELVRVYLISVENIFLTFMKERRNKLMEDKKRWTSLCAFWSGMDQKSRRQMSRVKIDVILKLVVKHFFIKKEVTSSLVMHFLFDGWKLWNPNKEQMIHVDKHMFVLADDAMLLLEKAVLEPFPFKRGLQNRMEAGDDDVERDEKLLTEFARRTLEVFVLDLIFCNKIEVAYKETIALKMQEELIREEEDLKKLSQLKVREK